MPCTRCFRLALRCEPARPSFLLSPEAAAAAIGVPAPMLELAMRTFDPHKLAARFIDAFRAAFARGQIDPGPALAMLRAYRARARALGGDHTFGALDAMAAALELSGDDLEWEPWGAMKYGPPPPLGGGGGSGGWSDSDPAVLRAVLEGSRAWRLASGPGLPSCASVYIDLPTSPAPVLLSKGVLLDAASLLRLLAVRRTLAPLLLAGCVWGSVRAVKSEFGTGGCARRLTLFSSPQCKQPHPNRRIVDPDDWDAWFELELAANFSERSQACTRFIRVCN